MNINTNPAEGMRDLMPAEVELRNYVISTILNTYKKFGFSQIETPCIERISSLSSGDGGENEKMLFKILKRGDKLNITTARNELDLVDLGLRYDLTIPLVRFYSNNKNKLSSPFKAIQVGSVWRAERPQKGRFRQFTQCDIDIFGVADISAEIELILATCESLSNLAFSNFVVRINNRRILEAMAKHCGFEPSDFSKVFIILDKLDKIGVDGVKKELYACNFSLRQIANFLNIVSLAIEGKISTINIQNIIPGISEGIVENLSRVINLISKHAQSKYSIELDVSLVRGMGYYTGQIFEIAAPGFKSSIAGGGRYDKMVSKMLQTVETVPACGFSIGFERVITILQERGFKIENQSRKVAILYEYKEVEMNSLISTAQRLRQEGLLVSLIESKRKNLKYQLDILQKNDFDFFVLFDSLNESVLKPLRSNPKSDFIPK